MTVTMLDVPDMTDTNFCVQDKGDDVYVATSPQACRAMHIKRGPRLDTGGAGRPTHGDGFHGRLAARHAHEPGIRSWTNCACRRVQSEPTSGCHRVLHRHFSDSKLRRPV